jgi:DNA-binding GntR family transcriptional regulator
MRIPAHSVCTAIRDDIVAGVYERGSRLTEELLARRYGVSRVPVREALRTLEAEGFVVTRRHAGACVAEPTEQEGADVLEMRMLLEPLGASRAAQRRTEAHLKVLRGLVRLGQERARRGNSEDLRSLGGWFHETLAQASGSPALTSMLTQLRQPSYDARLAIVTGCGSAAASASSRSACIACRRRASRRGLPLPASSSGSCTWPSLAMRKRSVAA